MSGEESPRVTLVTSNGWGLGHLSRQIATALAIGDRADVTLFSFSRGLPLVERFGIAGEYCPGHDSAWIPADRWKPYVEGRFRAFLLDVEPHVVLFDGVAPYLGILNALLDFPSISAGWLRRGMWIKGATDAQLSKASSFDFVIEPGDLAAEADRGPTARLKSMRVPPMSLLEVVPVLDRADAAAELGLDPDRPTLLLALGSGQPGDAVDARRVALDEAQRHEGWQVGLVNSPLADEEGGEVPGAVALRGVYPLMRYLTAFDAAVSAAGYNSVHELIPGGVPTLLVPKSASKTDNQVARASFLAERGLAAMTPDDDIDGVREAIADLLGEGGHRIRATLEKTHRAAMVGGAAEVARILTSRPPTGVRETGTGEWRQPGLKGIVKRAIGPTGVRLVQRALGRAPKQPPRLQVSLDPGSGLPHLVVTSDLEAVYRSTDQPVEHLLAGTSEAYRKTRHDLIDEFYEVAD